MRSVTYSMGVSLDGYIAGPDGHFDWTPPGEEVFRFVTDEIRQVGIHLLGRKLYETMLYWETADRDPRRRGGRAGPDRRVPGQGLPGAGWRWHPVLSPARAPGGSRTRRDPHLQLENRLPPLPRGTLAGASAEPWDERASQWPDLNHPAQFSQRALVEDPGPRPARPSRGGHRRRTSPDHPESEAAELTAGCCHVWHSRIPAQLLLGPPRPEDPEPDPAVSRPGGLTNRRMRTRMSGGVKGAGRRRPLLDSRYGLMIRPGMPTACGIR